MPDPILQIVKKRKAAKDRLAFSTQSKGITTDPYAAIVSGDNDINDQFEIDSSTETLKGLGYTPDLLEKQIGDLPDNTPDHMVADLLDVDNPIAFKQKKAAIKWQAPIAKALDQIQDPAQKSQGVNEFSTLMDSWDGDSVDGYDKSLNTVKAGYDLILKFAGVDQDVIKAAQYDASIGLAKKALRDPSAAARWKSQGLNPFQGLALDLRRIFQPGTSEFEKQIFTKTDNPNAISEQQYKLAELENEGMSILGEELERSAFNNKKKIDVANKYFEDNKPKLDELSKKIASSANLNGEYKSQMAEFKTRYEDLLQGKENGVYFSPVTFDVLQEKVDSGEASRKEVADYNNIVGKINKTVADANALAQKAASESVNDKDVQQYKEIVAGMNAGLNDAQDAKNLKAWTDYMVESKNTQAKRFPGYSTIAIQNATQDLIGAKTGGFKRFAYNLSANTAGELFEGLDRFYDWLTAKDDNEARERKMDDAYQRRFRESLYNYETQDQALFQSPIIPVLDNDTKTQLAEIDKMNISDEEKRSKKEEAVSGGFLRNRIQYVANPKYGKGLNLTSESIVNTVSNVTSQLVGQLIQAGATGGMGNVSKARRLATLFGTVMNQTFAREYDAAVQRGDAKPFDIATSKAVIEALSELPFDNIQAVKSFMPKSFSKYVGDMTDAQWKAIRKGKIDGNISRELAQSAEGLFKEGFLEEGLAQVGGNLADKYMFNKDVELGEGLKEATVTGLIGFAPMSLLGLPMKVKKANVMDKMMFYQAGFDFKNTIKGINQQVADGGITSEEAKQRIEAATKMNGIISKMSYYDKSGRPLTDEQKAKYAWNEYVKTLAKDVETLPTEDQAEVNDIVANADKENSAILNGTAGSELSNIERMSPNQIEVSGDPTNFAKEMTDAQASLGNAGLSVSPYEQDDYDQIAKDGGQFLRAFGGKILSLIKPNGEMVSLVKDSSVKVKGAAQAMISKMKDMGGLFMDNYDIYLTNLYEKAGYSVIARVPFNEEYAPEGWNAEDSTLKTKPDVVFMVRSDLAPAQEMKFDSYDEAQAYTQKIIDDAVASGKAKLPSQVAPIQSALTNAVDQAAKSLESAGISFEIVDSSTGDTRAAAARGNQAVFISDEGKIIIDRSKLQNDVEAGLVVWHEASHPVMNIIRNTNKPLYDKIVRGLNEAAKKNAGVAGALQWAQSQPQYDNVDTQNDEAMVETVGRINSGLIDINSLGSELKQGLIDFVNSIAKILGIDPILDDTDMTAFKRVVSDVSDALATGRNISEIVGEGNVKEFSNATAQDRAVTVAKGSESMSKYGLKNKYNTVRKIGEAFEKRAREKFGVIGREDRSPEAVNKISSFMADEVRYFVDEFGDNSGKGWYGEKFQKGIDAMARVFPELENDQNARDLFTMLVAVTSDGTEVMQNFKQASMAYQYYKDNGKLPTEAKAQRAASYQINFKNIQDLLDQYNGDIAKIKDYLLTVSSISDLNKQRKEQGLDKLNIQWPASFKVPLAASIFGPKLGMFFANLSGMENYPTLDRWWSRTFNRYRGTLIPQITRGFNKKGEALGIDRYRQIAGLVDATEDEVLAKIVQDHDTYEAKEYKNGTPSEKAANTLYKKLFVELNDAPFGAKDREFMYNTFVEAKKKLKRSGVDVSIADIQAILWYFEKNLYKNLGVTKPIQGISYEDAAVRTYQKWLDNGKSFDYTIKDSEKGDLVEEEQEEEVQASVGNRGSLVETAKLGKFMTEDANGNYVFFHHSPNSFRAVNPRKFGSNLFTGRDENPGVGISMFYTKANDMESGIQSDFSYLVRVPKDKVYPFNKDPMGLIKTARQEFIKDYGKDVAFDANKQLGYVTKVAAEMGYPMTVAEWTIKGKKTLRAQTTEKLPVEMYSKKEGMYGYVKDNPKYKDELEKFRQASVGNREGIINWEKLKPGKGDPKISSRNPIVTQAAADLKAGKITNEEYRAVAAENNPIRPITKFFEPATKSEVYNALSSDKLDKIDSSIKDGSPVGIRLDIPAFKNNNTWVVSVHEGDTNAGKAISYSNVARITDVNFGLEPKAGLKIAAGESKSTIGRIFGKWQNLDGANMEGKGETAKEIIQEAVGNPNWVQVGFNPFRHSYFYDRSSDMGRPIVSADEVVQIGGLVYAKKPVYGNWTDEAYRVKGLFDKAGAPVQFSVGNRDIINGFYSPIEDRINTFKQPKASVQKWKDIVGVKSDEAVYSGLAEWLGGMKPEQQLSKEDVLQFMKDNRIEIVEMQKGGSDNPIQKQDVLRDIEDNGQYEYADGAVIIEMDGDEYGVAIEPYDYVYFDTVDEAVEYANKKRGIADTKYSQYQLPGGENYKEVLITLPSEASKLREKFNRKYPDWGTKPYPMVFSKEDADIFSKALLNEKEFKSSHYDESNIITHLRMNTRTDADGKKVLFLEEVQSDWGQKGKREGFRAKDDNLQAQYDEVYEKANEAESRLTKAMREYRQANPNSSIDSAIKAGDKKIKSLWDEYTTLEEQRRQMLPAVRKLSEGVSSAPYVTNTNAWVKLGLKVALKEAVGQGADRIAWTTGQQQNDRYNLSNQVDEVYVFTNDDGTYEIDTSKDGRSVAKRSDIKESEIEGMLGRDLAAKIIEDRKSHNHIPGEENLMKVYKGDDLAVGGKGMRAFYGDAQNPGIVANVAKALVKELTGKDAALSESRITNGLTTIPNNYRIEKDDINNMFNVYKDGELVKKTISRDQAERFIKSGSAIADADVTVQPAIEITPELKASVQSGMPQFSVGNRSMRDLNVLQRATRNKVAGIKDFVKKMGYGYLPDDVQDRLKKKQMLIDADMNDMNVFVKRFNDAIKEAYGMKMENLPIGLADTFNDALQNFPGVVKLADKDALRAQIPDKVLSIIDDMRYTIDAMSKKLVDFGILDDSLEPEFDFNGEKGVGLGTYINRSYRKYDMQDWVNYIPEDVRTRAEKYLLDNQKIDVYDDQGNYTGERDMTAEEIEGLVNYIATNMKPAREALQSANVGSVKVDILKGRKVIPQEIRDLMGEYKDPIVNYAKTIAKMSTLLQTHEALTEIAKANTGTLFFDKPQGDFFVPVASEDESFLQPMSGLYTTPEIAEAFKQVKSQMSGEDWNTLLLQTLASINGIAKVGKTAYSPGSMVRNMIGGLFFMLKDGHLAPGAARKGWTSAFGYWANKSKDDPAFQYKIRQYISNGILGDGVQAGEFQAILKAANKYDDPVQWLQDNSKMGKFLKGAKGFYSAQDDVYRVWAFENELARLKSRKVGMTEQQMVDEAARKARATYPTYSELPNIIRKLATFIPISSFPGFSAELVRTTFNSAKIAMQELRDPDMRGVGAKRLAGTIMAVSLGSIIAQVSAMLTGVDDDEDESVRRYVPEWSKNSPLVWLGRDVNGLPTYIDLGFSDPFAYFKKPLYALSRDNGDLMDRALDASKELASPYISPEIFINAIAKGAKKVDNNDEFMDYVEKFGVPMYEALEPGGVSSVKRIVKGIAGDVDNYGQQYDWQLESLALTTGQRYKKLDVPVAFSFKTGDFTAKRRSIMSEFHKVKAKTVKDDEAISSELDKANRKFEKVFENYRKDYQAAMKLMTRSMSVQTAQKALKEIMEDRGVPRLYIKAIIKNREYPIIEE